MAVLNFHREFKPNFSSEIFPRFAIIQKSYLSHSCLASDKWDIGKQCRLRSGSALYAYRNLYSKCLEDVTTATKFLEDENVHQSPLNLEMDSPNEPPHDKTNKMACVPSEDSDQPGHPLSLIRVVAVRMQKTWVHSYPLSAQRRL